MWADFVIFNVLVYTSLELHSIPFSIKCYAFPSVLQWESFTFFYITILLIRKKKTIYRVIYIIISNESFNIHMFLLKSDQNEFIDGIIIIVRSFSLI